MDVDVPISKVPIDDKPMKETPMKEMVDASATTTHETVSPTEESKQETKNEEAPVEKNDEKTGGASDVKQAVQSTSMISKSEKELSCAPHSESCSDDAEDLSSKKAVESQKTSPDEECKETDVASSAGKELKKSDEKMKAGSESSIGQESSSVVIVTPLQKDIKTVKDKELIEDIEADDTGNESGDSEKTIEMDKSDIQKAFDIKAADDANQSNEGSAGSGEVASGGDKVASGDVEKICDETKKHSDGQKKDIAKGESSKNSRDSGDMARDMKAASGIECKDANEKEKRRIPADTNPGEKLKDDHQSDSFHSFDLPLHPVHEHRRSRSRQCSDEPGRPPRERPTDGNPLERSPSVASNRSEESIGSGGKDRRGSQSDINQRERKRSGASSKADSKSPGSTKMFRAGFEFKAGFKLEAMDFSKKWYPAKIVAIDDDDMEVHIHFEGWNSRFDEWISYKSDRLRPAVRTRKDASLDKPFMIGDTVLARWSDTRYYQGKIRGVNSNGSYRVRFYDGLEKSVQAGNIREMPEELRLIVSPKGYGIGDEVLARWNDCRYYPAKILSIKKNGAFRVLFYDGIEKSVQPFNVREMPAELKAQEFFKQFKDQIKASEEKNRQREKRERARAAIDDERTERSSTASPSGSGLKRKVPPTSPPTVQSKKLRHESSESLGSKPVDRKTSTETESMDMAIEQSDENTEVDYRQVVLKRGSGTGYYIKGFIYLKHRDGFNSWVLRCRVGNCHAKAVIIRKTGKAVIKQGKHSHPAPVKDTIEFCSTETMKSIPTGQKVKSPSVVKRRLARQAQMTPPQSGGSITSETPPSPARTPESSITPLSQLLSPEDLAKIKERDKKRIREPLIVDSALGVLRDPLKIHAPKELIIDLDHNKYKCEVPECGKSFRKAKLLEYHKKYYHVNTTTLTTAATAATKVTNKSRKRLTTSPTKSSRHSSEESVPAKVTRSQRSSAPSDLGRAVSPSPEPMSPPVRSPPERKKLPDTPGREKTKQRSGSSDKAPEVRVAKTPEMRIPIETKIGKIPETRIPKSPDGKLVRASDGRLVKTPEGKSPSSKIGEGKTRRPSSTERARSLSGSASNKPSNKPTKSIPVASRLPDVKGPKIVEKSADKSNLASNDSVASASSKDVIKPAGITHSQDVKPLDMVIKSEPVEGTEATVKPKEAKIPMTLDPSPQTNKPKISDEVVIHIRSSGEPSVKGPDSMSKVRGDRAKIKHKKKHRHKHEKGKEERSRDRNAHKSDRHRKTSEKSKVSDTEPGKSSYSSVRNDSLDHSDDDIKLEESYEDMDNAAIEEEEEVEMIEQPAEKEVINCVCGYMEEEGFMLQCERCYCWQHGCCEGVNQTTAPKQYVCTFCRHPRGERVQSKYHYDQDWFKTGKMHHYSYINQEDIPDTSENMLTTHNLMADIDAIHDVLYGLQHKMIILRNPNHPELALWAHPWRTGEEWDIDGQPDDHHTLDSPDLSNIVLDSLNTSMQSVEMMDTSNNDNKMDNIVDQPGDVSMDMAHSGDVTTKSGDISTQSGDVISQGHSSEDVDPKTESGGIVTDVSQIVKVRTTTDKVIPDSSMAKTDNTESSIITSDTVKSVTESPIENKELAPDVESDNISPSDESSKPATKEVQQETDKHDSSDFVDVEMTSQETNMVSDAKSEDNSPLPSQTATAEKTPSHASTGSVFGTQYVKDAKPVSGSEKPVSDSEKPVSDSEKKESISQNSGEKSSLSISSAVALSPTDHDKPGPSGLQQAEGVQKTPASDILKAMADGKPVPAGSHVSDVQPKSIEDVAMETSDVASDKQETQSNQLISTDVKVTGSSVWTAVQGCSSGGPSTSCPPEVRVPAAIPPPAVCQANLMEHIQTIHEELFDRLALVEEQIEALEIAYAQKHGPANAPPLGNEQESLALKRKMAVLMSDLEKLSNIDLTSHN